MLTVLGKKFKAAWLHITGLSVQKLVKQWCNFGRTAETCHKHLLFIRCDIYYICLHVFSQHRHGPFTSLHFSQNFMRQHRRPLRDHPHTQQPPGRWNQGTPCGTPSNPTRQLCWAKSTSLAQQFLAHSHARENCLSSFFVSLKFCSSMFCQCLFPSSFINLYQPTTGLPPKQLTTMFNDVQRVSPSPLPWAPHRGDTSPRCNPRPPQRM